MLGSAAGNFAGTLYFLIFQVVGILFARMLFKKEKNGFCLLIGSMMGSFALQWFPVLPAFFVGFNIISHVIAIFILLMFLAGIIIYRRVKKEKIFDFANINPAEISFKRFFDGVKAHPAVLFISAAYIYMILVLWQHVLGSSDTGAYMTGQCTYGDMNMHLGFITSIANQGFFPPEYSILPGTQLSYPFMSDSISSSVYIFGASLKWAYLLPMYVAVLQVFVGMYAIAVHFTRRKGRSLLAWLLFFLNGGFGTIYFITDGFSSENFKRIFTAFYETPTNYVTENIQWHNVIVDMLIPQRATLFGWAILFPLLYIIIKARTEDKKEYFIPAGVVAGGLPLIHTHSFLALGVLCAGFLFLDLKNNIKVKASDILGRKALQAEKNNKKYAVWLRALCAVIFLGIMQSISRKQLSENPIQADTLLKTGLLIVILFIIPIAYFIIKKLKENGLDDILKFWGIFLVEVLVLALPLLITFTFKQAVGDQFTRGVFGWANSKDSYITFCIKNYGVMFFMLFFTVIFGSKRQRDALIPAGFLWIICEFIVFQPNVYDNNKLLLVSYMFFCIVCSDFLCEKLEEVRPVALGKGIAVSICFLGTIAALLTMGREYVSEYELYSTGYVEAAKYIEMKSEPDDTILTATNHNNAVASLTGRNIVCGASTFLYYHGVDYYQNEADVKTMYENPDQRTALFDKYNVKYIVVGSYETGSYAIPDYDNLINSYPVVFNRDGVVILQVSDS